MKSNLTRLILVVAGFCALFASLGVTEGRSDNLPFCDGKPGTLAGQQCANPEDGAAMVWVPAGAFLMGSKNADAAAPSDEKPQHSIILDGYWIYKNDVTVAQYRAYCEATGAAMPLQDGAPTDSYPVVNVSWARARAYAEWAGCKLPTEAQWEKAARGTDCRIYPWGDNWDAHKCSNVETSPDHPTPVGSYPDGASPYGCLDIEGNVEQWCEDWYDESYYANSPGSNTTGPDTGDDRVLRGSSFVNDGAAFFNALPGQRISQRTNPSVQDSDVYSVPPTAVPTSVPVSSG